MRHPCSQSVLAWQFYGWLQSVASLWQDAAAAAAILLIYVCCTANGGYEKPEVWPSRPCGSAQSFKWWEAQSQVRVVQKVVVCASVGMCVDGLKSSASLNSWGVIRRDNGPFSFLPQFSAHTHTQTLAVPALTIRADSLPYVIAGITNPKKNALFGLAGAMISIHRLSTFVRVGIRQTTHEWLALGWIFNFYHCWIFPVRNLYAL